MNKEKVFVVVGLGIFGSELCVELSKKGAKVIAIDTKKSLIEKIKDSVMQAIIMDSTDIEALKSLPIEDIDLVVVAIGDDIEASILTTTLFKGLGVPYIVARSIKDIHAQILKQVGATEVINIEMSEGRRLADKLISPDLLEKIQLSDNVSIAEVAIHKKFISKNLIELDLRKKYYLTVVAIKRFTTEIDEVGNPVVTEHMFFPDPKEILQRGDILIVAGSDKKIEDYKED